MPIDLLGPLRIDGNEVSLQRRDEVVLSALTLRPGCAMTADQLAGALWGDEPPPSWPKDLLETETVAVIDEVGAVHLVDLANGTSRTLDALVDPDDVESAWPFVEATSDGRYLAAVWRPGLVEPNSDKDFTLLTVWDVRTVQRRFDRVRIPYRIGALVISDDGSLVAVGGGWYGRMQIRDGATGALLHELTPLPRPDDALMGAGTVSAAFAADGTLVVGSQAGPIRRFDAHTGAELQRIDSPQETADQYLFITEDDSTIITVGSLGAMGFDAASGDALWAEPHELPYCPAWVYAERLHALLCGEASGQVTAYDVMTGVGLSRRFDAQLGGVCGLAVSADGTSFAEVTSCYDGATIIEWRLDGGGAVARLVADTARAHRVQSFGLGDDPNALIAESGPETTTSGPPTSSTDRPERSSIGLTA